MFEEDKIFKPTIEYERTLKINLSSFQLEQQNYIKLFFKEINHKNQFTNKH